MMYDQIKNLSSKLSIDSLSSDIENLHVGVKNNLDDIEQEISDLKDKNKEHADTINQSLLGIMLPEIISIRSSEDLVVQELVEISKALKRLESYMQTRDRLLVIFNILLVIGIIIACSIF